MYLAQGHNTVPPVRLKQVTPQIQIELSTTELLITGSKNMQRKNEEDFQQCAILTSVDSDKPVKPPVKLRNPIWCSVSSVTVIGYSSDLQRL